MSKLNQSLKPTPKVVDERLTGGSGSFAARQSNIALLRRADVDRRTIQQGLKNLK